MKFKFQLEIAVFDIFWTSLNNILGARRITKNSKQVWVKIDNLQKPEVRIEYRDELSEYLIIDRKNGSMELDNKNLMSAWTVLWDIIFKRTSDVCGTALVERMTGDAWWSNEMILEILYVD